MYPNSKLFVLLTAFWEGSKHKPLNVITTFELLKKDDVTIVTLHHQKKCTIQSFLLNKMLRACFSSAVAHLSLSKDVFDKV